MSCQPCGSRYGSWCLASARRFVTTRRIVSPIRALSRATDEIARNNLNIRIPLQGPDEIRELANSFETMLARLREYRSQVESAQSTLEAKVASRTAALEVAT